MRALKNLRNQYMAATTNVKIFTDPEIGEVRLYKSSRSRRVSISVHPARGVRINVPYFSTYDAGLRFFQAKREWILKVMERQKKNVGEAEPLDREMILKLAREAMDYLPPRIYAFSRKYGLPYNRLTLKNNRSNWGSCSTKNNINLNIRLMMLPQRLQDYVMLHELSHLKHHDHSPQFHALLESLCADHFGAEEGDGSSKFPVSHALEKEIRKYSTSFAPVDKKG